MTPRDLAFWLQGYYELGFPGDSFTTGTSELIRKHADLVLVTHKGSEFAIAVRALAGDYTTLHTLVAAQFEHVIDASFPPPEKDPAHPVKPAPAWRAPQDNPHMLMRC